MYKTISIQNNTYQNLQAIASKMEKPKSQIVDELVKKRIDSMEAGDKKELQEFNEFVAKLVKKVKLPKDTKVNTEDLDKDFAALKDW